jgi:glutamate/tyrosine decarboxylase-like PLP-dependent enzyme
MAIAASCQKTAQVQAITAVAPDILCPEVSVTTDTEALLRDAAERALAFLGGLGERLVASRAGVDALRQGFAGAGLSDDGEPLQEVLASMVAAAEPGLIASAGPRYFGFVIGGSHPSALAADWLTSSWDQNAFSFATSPAAAVAEEITASWILSLLGLPATASVGFASGATMASFTALAAARHALLQRVGWNVEDDGLIGAPALDVVASGESHVTIFAALGLLGLGRRRVKTVHTDTQGRMSVQDLRSVLATCPGPVIVCAQAGNVNTGACDPLQEIADVTRARGAWLHVDGAFGLWAAASPRLSRLVQGAAAADSWTVDAHKWLNVPYGSGLAIVADASAHRQAMTLGASYYVETKGTERDPFNWVPESSRRALAFPIYAVLRSLGRKGVAALVERNCSQASLMVQQLAEIPGFELLNEVVLNQVLVRFHPAESSPEMNVDRMTRRVIELVQASGVCWLGGTQWRERSAMRISFCNWSTTDADVLRSAAAIREAAAQARKETA